MHAIPRSVDNFARHHLTKLYFISCIKTQKKMFKNLQNFTSIFQKILCEKLLLYLYYLIQNKKLYINLLISYPNLLCILLHIWRFKFFDRFFGVLPFCFFKLSAAYVWYRFDRDNSFSQWKIHVSSSSKKFTCII